MAPAISRLINLPNSRHIVGFGAVAAVVYILKWPEATGSTNERLK